MLQPPEEPRGSSTVQRQEKAAKCHQVGKGKADKTNASTTRPAGKQTKKKRPRRGVHILFLLSRNHPIYYPGGTAHILIVRSSYPRHECYEYSINSTMGVLYVLHEVYSDVPNLLSQGRAKSADPRAESVRNCFRTSQGLRHLPRLFWANFATVSRCVLHHVHREATVENLFERNHTMMSTSS